jgi:hypothetical protein
MEHLLSLHQQNAYTRYNEIRAKQSSDTKYNYSIK